MKRTRGFKSLVALLAVGLATLVGIGTAMAFVPPNGLVAHYPLDGNAKDVSGNGNHGVVSGGVVFTPGKFGQAADMSSGLGVGLPNSLIQGNNTPEDTVISVSLWFMTTSDGVLLGYQDALPINVVGGHTPALYVGVDGKLHGGLWDAPMSTSVDVVNDGNWHHVVLAAAQDGISLYLDNAPVGTVVGGMDNSTLPGMIYNQLGIGVSGDWVQGKFDPAINNWHRFAGTIDEVRIYKSTLTAEHVASLYEAGNSLIINGSFELGNVGFDTEYLLASDPVNYTACKTPQPLWMNAGCYDVVNDASTAHSSFGSFGDHTSGTGKMLVANGDIAPDYVWQQTVDVAAATNYLFTAYATSVLQGDTSPAYLLVQADLTQACGTGNTFQTIGSINATANANDWVENRTAIRTGASAQICLRIVNNNTAAGGNDYAIDDLSLVVDPRVPTVVDDTVSTIQDTPVTFSPWMNDYPLDDFDMTTFDLDPATPGIQSYVAVPGGSFSGYFALEFTPEPGFSGVVSLTYQVSSASSGVPSNVATITVTVTPTYTLSVNMTGLGLGMVNGDPIPVSCNKFGCSAVVEAGTVMNLTATPDFRSLFGAWSGACSGSEPVCQITMDANKNVTASFNRLTYALTVVTTGNGTVTSDLPGISCGSDCSESYLDRSMIMLTATPAEGSTFAGWGGACAGEMTDSCYVSMSGAQDVTATFETLNLPPCGNISSFFPPKTSTAPSMRLAWSKSATPGVEYVLTQNDVEVYRGPNLYAYVSTPASGDYNFTLRAVKAGYADSAVKQGMTSVTLTCGSISSFFPPATLAAPGTIRLAWSKSGTPGVEYVLTQNGVEVYRGPNLYAYVSLPASGEYTFALWAEKVDYVNSIVKGGKTVVNGPL